MIMMAAIVPVLVEREETISRKEILEDNLISVFCVRPETVFLKTLPFNMWSMEWQPWYYQGAR